MKSSIGFSLASIHTGSGQSLWASLAEYASKSGDEFFIFPLGRLEGKEDGEAMRASVAPLINKKNIDGLISWGSTLGGVVSQDEVVAYHEENFASLPYVTIGLKCKDHAEISFDAYSGFKSAIEHLIKVHNVKKIAYVRGPEAHASAEDRYRAYLDALKENDIEIDEDLISRPHSWSEGEEAVKELIEGNSLKAGLDFEAIAFASDMMMLSGGRYLEHRGVRIPKEVKLVGFNNSAESKLLRTPCTTCQMPYERMGTMAYNILKGIFSSKNATECPDVVLPAELIIRRSCGCRNSFGAKNDEIAAIKDRSEYKEWANKTFALKDDEAEILDKIIVLSFAFPLLEDEEDELLLNCSRFFERLLRRGVDINLIYELIEWSFLINKSEDYEEFAKRRIISLVGTSLSRVNLLTEFERSERDKNLNMLNCELLSLKNFPSLALSLQKHLPHLDISAAFVVLKTDSLKSRFVAGFDRDTLFDSEIEFDDDLILPDAIKSQIGSGAYIVSALFSENTELGYLVLRMERFEGTLAEEIRTSISSAVQGTYLLESSNKARIYAEKAEKARNEFFSNISEDLRDPLERIKRAIETLNLDDASKAALTREIEGANHILDLSLAETGELEIERKLINLEDVLSEISKDLNVSVDIESEIPLIYFDESRLKEALKLLVNLSRAYGCGCNIECTFDLSGVNVLFKSNDKNFDYSLLMNDSSYMLAERIMVMHQGTLKSSLGSLILSFAIPTFSLESAKAQEKGALDLSGKKLAEKFDLPSIEGDDAIKKRKITNEIGSLFWSLDERSYDTLSLIRTLSRDSATERIPLYFFGHIDSSYSPLSLIDHMMMDFEAPPVLILGTLPDAMKSVLSEKNTIELETLDDYPELDRDKRARVMIITNEVDAKMIAEFRRSSDVNFIIILMLNTFTQSYAESVGSLPRTILVNTCIAESEDFLSHFNSILAGSDVLPAFTGSLVKKALGYLVSHATSQITRWQLAESVNVSEDYLTRIFRKELGLSPWDYLNRYRIYLASEMLKEETMSVNEVAYRTGFQDQAYFCRVFKKIKGMSPGKMRKRN